MQRRGLAIHLYYAYLSFTKNWSLRGPLLHLQFKIRVQRLIAVSWADTVDATVDTLRNEFSLSPALIAILCIIILGLIVLLLLLFPDEYTMSKRIRDIEGVYNSFLLVKYV